jgi:hypothetical protein
MLFLFLRILILPTSHVSLLMQVLQGSTELIRPLLTEGRLKGLFYSLALCIPNARSSSYFSERAIPSFSGDSFLLQPLRKRPHLLYPIRFPSFPSFQSFHICLASSSDKPLYLLSTSWSSQCSITRYLLTSHSSDSSGQDVKLTDAWCQSCQDERRCIVRFRGGRECSSITTTTSDSGREALPFLLRCSADPINPSSRGGEREP